MGKIYADAAGNILRLLDSPELERRYPAAPPGAARELAFDEDTNPDLVQGYGREANRYRLTPGGLQRDGSPVAVNPDGPARRDIDLPPAVKGAIRGVSPSPLGAAQVTALVAALNDLEAGALAAPMTPENQRRLLRLLFQLVRDCLRIRARI